MYIYMVIMSLDPRILLLSCFLLPKSLRNTETRTPCFNYLKPNWNLLFGFQLGFSFLKLNTETQTLCFSCLKPSWNTIIRFQLLETLVKPKCIMFQIGYQNLETYVFRAVKPVPIVKVSSYSVLDIKCYFLWTLLVTLSVFSTWIFTRFIF